MNVKLVVRGGKLAGKEIAVKTNQFLIGRDESCNLRPNSNMVSKIHCAIVISDEAVWLRDMKSTNGTYRNGERVTDRVQLQNGDEIRVGPLVFEIRLPEAPKQAAPAEAKATAPSAKKKEAKPAKLVEDDDVFEWLSEDEEAVEVGDSDSESDILSARENQTVLDMNLSESETLHELKEDAPSKTAKSPAPATGSTTEAAAKALKGLMTRKRA